MEQISAREYVESHIKRVRKWLNHFSTILFYRGATHDESKLTEPEFSQWCKIDEEPRYKYGTPEYNDKLARYHYLFEMHWKNPKNRHHPEHFTIPNENGFIYDDRDLIDLVEMLCDWLGYRDNISYTEAVTLVQQQCERFGFSDELHDLLLNTLVNNFATFGGGLLADDTDTLREKAKKKMVLDSTGLSVDMYV